MSIGFKASANLVTSDNEGFLYGYTCCNLNLKDNRQSACAADDGEIWISRDALLEPEIHERIQRLPSGRKKTMIKKIPRWVPVRELIVNGKISVKNSGRTWETEDSVDIMALRILENIFREYQVQGIIPEHVSVVL